MGRGFHYNIYKDKTSFMTMMVVEWIDLFTRVTQKQLIVDLLKYCQENKGLNIFGWCLMPSHMHLIANTKIPFDLDDVVRDFKRHTSKIVYKEQDYLFCSARNYYGLPNVLKIECLIPPVTTSSSSNFFNRYLLRSCSC